MKHLYIFIIAWSFFSSWSDAEYSVKFPPDFDVSPYTNDYRFEFIEFFPNSQYSISKDRIDLPPGDQFIKLEKFFRRLYLEGGDSCRVYFTEWTPDIRTGLNALSSIEDLEIVAIWQKENLWAVVFSKNGLRERSLIPLVFKDTPELKFLTDASSMGDFFGLLGKYFSLHPDGSVQVVNILDKEAGTQKDVSSNEVIISDRNFSLVFLTISTILVFFIILWIYVYRIRK